MPTEIIRSFGEEPFPRFNVGAHVADQLAGAIPASVPLAASALDRLAKAALLLLGQGRPLNSRPR